VHDLQRGGGGAVVTKKFAPASAAPPIVVEKNWKNTMSRKVPPTAARLFFMF
jgi:hypothetical protein